MTSRPVTAAIVAIIATIGIAAAGCQGAIDGLDPEGEGTYAACTSYHACCPPDKMVCEGDVDTNTACTCKQLWTCHPGAPQKCEGSRVVPPGGGAWSCSWSEASYQCTQAGGTAPSPAAGQGRWSCQSAAGGLSCSIPPPNPSNVPGGERVWDCSVDNADDRIACQRQGAPACVPVAEVCGNKKDDDCDGKVDCADADCSADCKQAPPPVEPPPPPPTTPPPPKPCTSYKSVQCAGIGHCNKHIGDNLAACKAAGNAGGCSSAELYAWCTRRVSGLSGQGGPWWSYIKQWVEKKCGGPATLTWDAKKQQMDLYVCKNTTTCNIYKCETPLVLAFDAGVSVSLRPDDGRGRFDLSGDQDGSGVRTDWPTAATPWLVLDRDGDGAISSGRELFGSATQLASGGTARDGFEALAPLDEDRDGVLDARDPGFARLMLWSDRDGDRVSSPAELTSLGAAGVVSLSLRSTLRSRCDGRGNCEVERAAFLWRGPDGRSRRGAVVDLNLSIRRQIRAPRPAPTCEATFPLSL